MKIGILSSGGDCPGINATIRGVGKTAIMHYGMEVIGIHSGFIGLLNKDVQVFDERSLSGILNLGGTISVSSWPREIRKSRRSLRKIMRSWGWTAWFVSEETVRRRRPICYLRSD